MLKVTAYIFISAFLFLCPACGVIGASQSVEGKPSIVIRVMAFILCTLLAYMGWLLGGFMVLQVFSHYPFKSPEESVALLFTFPGIVTGALAVLMPRLILRRDPSNIAAFGLGIPILLVIDAILLFYVVASLFPKQG